ncbi:hypothetical protein CR513_14229, partial [Mucuna pruriens]
MLIYVGQLSQPPITKKQKSKVFATFRKFKMHVEKTTTLSLKTLRIDRGGEFTSYNFNNFCDEHGIQRQLITIYLP